MELSINDILHLSVKERISMVEAIWDSVVSETDISLTRAQKAEIDRRLELYATGETQTYSWKEIKSSFLP
ncbi:MAG: addiction module protein [Cyclobacteriaceae bacterium]|nr:addiction module protein [Cyclobacteriaceae bacterium]